MKKWVVMSEFIHPHKDCGGEGFETDDFSEAQKIKAEWEKDRIHKNVFIDEWIPEEKED